MNNNRLLQPEGRETETDSAVEDKPYNRIAYWDSYYTRNAAPKIQSKFAEYCLPMIKKNAKLLELGCGNGRDAFYFARNDIYVWACDISPVAISKNQNNATKDIEKRIKFINTDFITFNKDEFNISFCIIYSRFTFHAIDNNSGSRTLNWCYESLRSDGLLLIEARSTKDPLFKSGCGRLIAKNTFVYEKGHIRRFIQREELIRELTDLGFKIERVIESDNLSICDDDNPVLIRVVAKK